MSNGIVQISCLGRFGRFGNQLFQYAFARTYAETIGATLETPPWVGQFLFGLNDPPLSRCLPVRDEGSLKRPGDHIPEELAPPGPGDWVPNVDLFGYFQTFYTMRHVSTKNLLSWFKLRPEIEAVYPKKFPVYAACHIRQGDYITLYPGNFCTIDKKCYERAIEKYAPGAPVIWLEENNAAPHPNLPPELQWLPDWMTLYHADILFRGNSTFSFWAALLGQVPKVYCPAVRDNTGPHSDIDFVPGNHEIWFPGSGDYHSMVFPP